MSQKKDILAKITIRLNKNYLPLHRQTNIAPLLTHHNTKLNFIKKVTLLRGSITGCTINKHYEQH